jgi:hypothetical protein
MLPAKSESLRTEVERAPFSVYAHAQTTHFPYALSKVDRSLNCAGGERVHPAMKERENRARTGAER